MKIAIFASAFHPHTGGVEELVRQLAHAYRRAGHEAIVITNRWPRNLPAFEKFEGIALYRLALRSPGDDAKSRVTFTLSSASIQRQVKQILKEAQIQLVHVQCISSNGFYAAQACRQLGLPLVVTTQGERTMDASQIFQRSVWFQNVMRDCLAQADHITACSRDTLLDVETFFGQPFGSRAEVIYNGIRLADFEGAQPYAHQRPYIFGIGRMVPQKGFDVLLRAFSVSQCPQHDLLLAGDGPELDALQALTRELGIEKRVHFFGRANRAQAVSLFKGCDFFVLPSRREPQGIVNLEAMCAGKAVIAANVGGVPEIVSDGETGLLFPCEDVTALASLLTELASNTGLRNRLGTAGLERSLSFDWDVLAEKYLQIYRSSLSSSDSVSSGSRNDITARDAA
ncbi:MAG: glycosyltransferase family 4 protein [Armatimonadetes bacterium]|nr:glycosyltransferase family 4 protein [Armatimonadota bacterium]